MPSTSVSAVAMFLYGYRAPADELRLSSMALTRTVSVTTAWLRSFSGVDARLIRPWKGDAGCLLRRSTRALGIRFALILGERDVQTSGSSSVTRPRGSGCTLL